MRDDPLSAARGIVNALLLSLLVWAALAFAALAQVGAPTSCSGTVGTNAATVTMGHAPTSYVTVSNPHASNSLWINPTGTAAANTAGSFGLTATGAGLTWSAAMGYPPPLSFSIIASGSSTPYTCWFQ